ncbi:MAG: DUF2911 domain-containing protein [Ginsengibacter sp.]
MKRLFNVGLLAVALICGNACNSQDKAEDKSKRASPPAKVSEKIKSGATITIDYGQPSVKGRTIGKDVEPMDGKVWRTGANEATVFETDKELSVQDGRLPAGKYGLFTVFNGNDVTVIFNKTANQWGAFKYSEADDALRIKTKASDESAPSEKLTFKIDPSGLITLLWGAKKVEFSVK